MSEWIGTLWGRILGRAGISGIAVIERAELTGDFDWEVWAYEKKAALRLLYLERVALGTPYPEVVERVLN